MSKFVVDSSDLDDFARMLERTANANQDLSELTEELTAELEASTKATLDAAVSPGKGNPWQPLSEATQAIRRKRGSSNKPILGGSSGRLGKSLKQLATAKRAVLTSEAPFAGVHQAGLQGSKVFGHSGDHNIPARPFLGITDEQLTRFAEKLLENMLENWNK